MTKVISLILGVMTATSLQAATQTILTTRSSVPPVMIPNYGDKLPDSQLLLISRYMGKNLIEGVRGPVRKDDLPPSNGLQKEGLYSLSINTQDLRNKNLFTPIQGGGPHYWISKNFNDQTVIPFSDSLNSRIEFSAEVRVPLVRIFTDGGFFGLFPDGEAHGGVSASEAPVTQLNFGIYFKNVRTGETFASLIGLYESRGAYAETKEPANDTYVNFTSSPILNSSQLISIAPDSARLQSLPFTDFKKFKVSISRAQFQRILKIALPPSHSSLEDFKITMVGLMFELPNYHESGNNTSLVEVRNFQVDLVNP